MPTCSASRSRRCSARRNPSNARRRHPSPLSWETGTVPPFHLLFDAHGDAFCEFKRYVGLQLRVPWTSLNVLDLLAHLLDQDLNVDRRARGLDILRLRRERVGLAVQLLHQEVEPPPGWLLRIEHLQDLGHVTPQAVEFFLDIHLAGEQRDLLLEALGVDRDAQLCRAIRGPRLDARAHLGHARAHGPDALAQRVAALPQRVAQPCTLAGARFVELGDRFREQRHRLGCDRCEIAIGLAYHTRPAQYVKSADRAVGAAEHLRDLGRALLELGDQGTVELERGRFGRGTAQINTCLYLAAPQARAEQCARIALEATQLVRQPQRQLQVAVVDGSQLAAERPPRALTLASCEAGHAADHWSWSVAETR